MFDHFGILAPVYERFIKPKPPEELWRLAELPVDGVLFDVGGGTGRIAQFMLDKASKVIVADLSLDMLMQAKQKDGLQTVCSYSETLPFGDNYFARILMVDALHHVCDQAQTARELWRVLQPGGILVIEEPDLRSGVVKFIALAEKLALMRSHFLSPPKIAVLFEGLTANVSIHTHEHIAWVVVKK